MPKIWQFIHEFVENDDGKCYILGAFGYSFFGEKGIV